MKKYKIQIRSQKNSQSCIPLRTFRLPALQKNIFIIFLEASLALLIQIRIPAFSLFFYILLPVSCPLHLVTVVRRLATVSVLPIPSLTFS